MGVAEMEEIVTTIKAMLKTLECPICLELLKTPVSAGCGHFFCKQCITGILQSTYRAPCPLCKRSFTRRSVQEAQQRQTVILAAKQLANTCTSLTEVKFFVQDVYAQENQKSSENISVISKKTKLTKVEKKETPSRKRKSIENEGAVNVISVVSENVPDLEMKKYDEVDENAPNDEYSSPNKRPCSEDNDSDELPKIEDVFKLCAQTKKNTNVSATTNKVTEKSLFITATDKISAIKTYSSAHKKTLKNNVAVSSSGDASNSDLSKSTSHATSSLDKNNKDILNDENETKIIEPNDNSVQVKNLLNALKNKTNEVQSNLCIVENNLRMKDKNLNENKLIKSDGSKSKENALCKSPPNRKLKLRRKSQTKLQNAVRNISSGDKSLNQVVASKICKTLPTESPSEKDCYTLNQVTLLNAQNENKVCPKEQPDDPFKAIGITDTAVSVDSVTSPLAATKSNSVRKSPGWSRVKKEKKDFKMKKFTTLHVEKNSTNVSFKNASASDQETESTINKADQCLAESNINRNEDQLLDSKHEDKLNVTTGESVLAPQKRIHEADENILYNADESSMHCNNMDCSLNYETESNTDKPDANFENIVTPRVAAKLRTVSSMNNSSSSFSEKFPNTNSKISSKNALKKQKIMCELKNTPSSSTIANQNDISECVVQENGPHWKEDYLFSNTQIKQGAFNLPTDHPSYQHRELVIFPSLKNIDVPRYVEQSQQTSQVFNLNFQNPVCDNVKTVLPHQPFHSLCPSTERTKVVKRTAFTLEEIQDCFFKSNQTSCSQTLCSVSFFSGLFKLHIGVSDETLNVSVFKVIDSSPGDASSNTACVLSDMASSNLFPPDEVVPSSDVGSESSQPNATRDPYPYLDKESIVDKTSQLASNLLNEIGLPVTELTLKDKFKTVCHNTASTIVKSSIQDDFPVEVLESKCTTEDYMDEVNLNMSEIIHFPAKLLSKDNFAVIPRKHFPQPENCKVSDPEKKQLMECNFSVNEKDSNIFADPLPQHKNDAQSNPETNHVSIDCDFLVKKGKSTCDLLQKASVSSNVEQVDLDFSDSDDEEPLKKFKEYARKQQTDKKQSRLSLKKRSSFRRIKVQDSSEESDSEISLLGKDTLKVVERETASKLDNLFKLPSTTENLNSLKESSKTDLKKGVCNSPADMPSTLNSILSEDTPEANASEIILEIEDLSDKIKSLEEKLKHCEHDDGKNKNNSLNDSDSEDSTDLFPQSVPPTPPNHI